MDREIIRKRSIEEAARLEVVIANQLPLLDEERVTRSADAIFDRLLCLHATAACAYGFDRGRSAAWLRSESAFESLSAAERQFLDSGSGEIDRFKVQVEAMWAMAWALGIVPHLDFGSGCNSNFVGSVSDALRSRIRLRSDGEIVALCDLAYCLHWSIRQATANGRTWPGKVAPYVVEERRRCLEWLVGNDAWTDVSLDT